MLTAKQEKFVQNIITGMTQADAYRNSYNAKKMTDKQIWEEASKLMAKPKVAQRVQELRAEMASDSIMSAKERLEFLTRVIKGEENDKDYAVADLNTKLKAVDIMNKMQGEYVQKVVADVTTYEDNLKKVVEEDEY
jgi:phage terminase small subunit